MAKLTLTDIAGGYGLVTTYNANNDLIEAALENTLSRDGTSPNTMSANLDMNSNRVVNVSDPSGNQDAATKTYVDTSITNLYTGEVDFSTGANYTITGAWTFSGNQNFSGDVVITDGSGDDMTIKNNGGFGDFSIDYDGVSGGNINFNDWDSLRLYNGAELWLFNTGSTARGEIVHDGTDLVIKSSSGDNLRFDGTLATVQCDNNFFVNGAHLFRVYDGGDDDYISLFHSATYATIATAGTGVGAVDLYLDPGANSVLIGNGSSGSLKVKEGAAAGSDTTGYGQYWVDSTKKTPMFTTESGTDYDVGVIESGSFTGTLTGCTTSPTATIEYTKEKLPTGNYRITLFCADASLTGTSNTTAMTITGMPAAIQSATKLARINTYVQDNGSQVPGMITVTGASSTITFWMTSSDIYGTANFTASGTKGIPQGWNVTYLHDLDT